MSPPTTPTFTNVGQTQQGGQKHSQKQTKGSENTITTHEQQESREYEQRKYNISQATKTRRRQSQARQRRRRKQKQKQQITPKIHTKYRYLGSCLIFRVLLYRKSCQRLGTCVSCVHIFFTRWTYVIFPNSSFVVVLQFYLLSLCVN